MKSVKEIQNLLIGELWRRLDKVSSVRKRLGYYNEVLGDTSFLLSKLLELHLKLSDEWDVKRWLDDSLITKIKLKQNKLSIWGVMIWGVENSTEQWTDPFYFEIELNEFESDFNEYTFLFGDLYKPEISYEYFRVNQNYWRQSERNWKYIFNQKVSK